MKPPWKKNNRQTHNFCKNTTKEKEIENQERIQKQKTEKSPKIHKNCKKKKRKKGHLTNKQTNNNNNNRKRERKERNKKKKKKKKKQPRK